MQIKSSKPAPMGLAFLFLGLAIVPISLKAVGLGLDLSPRVRSVTEAWGQIAGVFGSSPKAVEAAQWAALRFRPAAPHEAEAANSEPQPEVTQVVEVREVPETCITGSVETGVQAARGLGSVSLRAKSSGARVARLQHVEITISADELTLGLNARMKALKAIHNLAPDGRLMVPIKTDLSDQKVIQLEKALKAVRLKIPKTLVKTERPGISRCSEEATPGKTFEPSATPRPAPSRQQRTKFSLPVRMGEA